MSTINPNKITKIKYKGTLLTGRIITVGIDGVYTYNYNHPQDALNAAINGDIILIYPGTYSPKNGLVLSITKDINVYIRGMGESPNDVILTTPSDIYHTIRVDYTNASNLFVVVENLKVVANRAWSGAFVHRQCSASTTTILNKLYLSATNYGYPVYFGDSIAYADYKGNCYITNCSLEKGYSHFLELGSGSSTSIISVQKTHYINGSYSCYNCSRAPVPNDYSTTAITNYGYLYGYLFLDITTDSILVPDILPKRNIWSKDHFTYKATSSGIKVYDNETVELLKYIQIQNGANSVWADESYLYIATTTSGIVRCSTTSIIGTPIIEQYKSYPDITDNYVNYIHGDGDYLCASTATGVDRYRLSDNDRNYTIINNVSKCFQLSNGDYYYIVNPFYNIIGLDDNLFNWNYGRKIILSSSVHTDNTLFLFEIPLTQPDEIYRQAQQDGNDIRIIDDRGVLVDYHINTWDGVSKPSIWATLCSGTNYMYVLYGNSRVESKEYGASIWEGATTISGYTISRGENIDDLLDYPELHAVYADGGEYIYISKQGSLLNSSYISDIYVTKNTSRNNGNVIFIATPWGATIIEEKRGDESNASKRIYLITS